MTYAQYKDTLIAAATRHDERLKPASVRAKRVVQAAETAYGVSGGDWFNQGYLDAGDNFFSSSDNEPTLIHRLAQRTATNKGANQSRLPREIWDKLSPDIQAEIKEWNRTKAFQSRPKAQPRMANIHDIMGYAEEVDVSTGDDSDEYVTEDVVIDESKDLAEQLIPNEESTEILAHITKQKPLPASHDIRKILASAHRRNNVNNHAHGPHQRNRLKLRKTPL